MPDVSASINAENTFTDPLGLDHSNRVVAVNIHGTFDATVSVQRSIDGGANWHTMEQYTEPTERNGEGVITGELWRAGVETGNFTSGPVEITLKY